VRRTCPAWLPSRRQLLLLRASLWEQDAALAAWREWRRDVPDLASLDRGSRRLLPLAYRNLGSSLSGGPDAQALRDAYRRSWTANQLVLRGAGQAIGALRAAELEVLVLKGAALIETAYGDAGSRPMADVDLAVRPERAAEAARALSRAGFLPVAAEPERQLRVHHSTAFVGPREVEVDLHRDMLWLGGLEEGMWRGSIEGEVAGAPVRVLAPADQLLQVCAHGAAWNPVHPVRWAADAFKVLERAGEKFDWTRLVAQATQGRLVLPLRQALSCLAEELAAPVPAGALAELAAIRVSRSERLAHGAIARPPSLRRSLGMLWWFWERHRAQAQLERRRPSPAGLARHLQEFWGLERPSQMPDYAMRRLLRR
jgi:putative nucleotidyltransferase-like protein